MLTSGQSKSKPRILLDRSAFTTELRFGKLKGALASVVPHKAEVFVTPRLLDETLKLWLDHPRSVEVREHTKFILEIGSPRWFNEPVEISKLELCSRVLPDKYWFFPLRTQLSLEENVRALIQGGVAQPEIMPRVRLGVQKERERADKLHERGVKIQYEVPRRFKAENPGQKLPKVNARDAWVSHVQTRLVREGEVAIIRKHVYQAGKRSIALKRWAEARERCPFFTNWVKGILYTDFYAAYYPNLAVDEHPQADIEHLLCLEQADVLVSEDKKFMRQAFVDLYKDRKKQFWTLDELQQWATGDSDRID